MTSSKLCTVALFMKDTKDYVKNYCKTEVKPNSILPKAYHIIDGSWFIASWNFLTVTATKRDYDSESTFRYNQAEHVLYCYG